MDHTAAHTAQAPSSPSEGKTPSPARLPFIDSIRVFLTILVVLHHLMITYSGTGSWFYNEGTPDFIAQAIGGWFCATNQSYFMGLFLFISAYFVPGSFDRKGAGRFLKDRLVRLGLPLAIYSWIIHPVFVYILYRDEIGTSFWGFYPRMYFGAGTLIGQGPLWFVEVLLLFSLAYLGWRALTRSRTAIPSPERPFPRMGAIVLFALGIALATFVVRTAMPMDSFTFDLLNLQLPFFVQYIALFVVGLIAYRRNWIANLPEKSGRGWLIAGIALVILWVPMMLTNGAAEGDMSFKGSWTWQALVYALWESLLCVSMSIGVLHLFRRYFNRPGALGRFLIPNAYTAYLIHAPVIVALSLAVRGVPLYPLVKWLLLAPIAIGVCFGLAALVRKLPYSDRVL